MRMVGVAIAFVLGCALRFVLEENSINKDTIRAQKEMRRIELKIKRLRPRVKQTGGHFINPLSYWLGEACQAVEVESFQVGKLTIVADRFDFLWPCVSGANQAGMLIKSIQWEIKTHQKVHYVTLSY